jgi:hypothetical protein
MVFNIKKLNKYGCFEIFTIRYIIENIFNNI